MKKNIKRLIIIPARLGSKRIKNKNIKKFFKKPIIFYSIESAIKSNLFDKIHVSTESNEIFKLISKYKLSKDFLRPNHLSGDKAKTFDVIRFVVKLFEKKGHYFDEIWCLSACSPLINYKDLILASKVLDRNPKKIVLPITEYSAPIEWAFKLKKNGNLIPKKVGSYKIRSQNLGKHYHDIGNFICFKRKLLDKINKKFLIDLNYYGLKFPKYKSIDIDDLDDWKLAEIIFSSLKKNL